MDVKGCWRGVGETINKYEKWVVKARNEIFWKKRLHGTFMRTVSGLEWLSDDLAIAKGIPLGNKTEKTKVQENINHSTMYE